MKKLTNPEIETLSSLLKEYDEILFNHITAKIVSLPERRRILEERYRIHSLLVEKRKKAFLGG